MLAGFKQFILRGNVIDLAVAVVIGAAFTAVVSVIGESLITPLVNRFLALLGLSSDGIGGVVSIGAGQVLNFGAIFTAALTFLITAAVVYYVFVAPMNAYKSKAAKEVVPEPDSVEVTLLREIRDLLAGDGAEGKSDPKS